MPASFDAALQATAFAKASRRLLPLLFACYIVSFLDRVNVGFAKLQMAGALGFSDAVYGFGAGIFFIGYFLFEVPSNLILARVGARRWIARIMLTWGVVSGAFAFVAELPWGPLPALAGVAPSEFSFYALRFILGVAEAGFFPGIILYLTYWYPAARRARAVALFMTAVAAANVIGAPVSGAIMQYLDGAAGWAGWRWLFVLEALPSLVLGVVVLRALPDGPQDAAWLTPAERAAIADAVAADWHAAPAAPHRVRDALGDGRVWALAFVYLSSALALYAVNFWMPTLVQELGIGRTEYLTVGLLSMIPWGVAGLAMVAFGAHSDRTGERRLHVAAALACTAAGLAALAVVGHAFVPSMVALTTVAVGVLCVVSSFWAIPTSFLRASAAAAGIAWINAVGNLGGHFGPDLIGRLRTATGSASWAFAALAATVAAGGVVLLLATRPRRAAA